MKIIYVFINTVPPDKITIVYNGETEIDGGTHHVIGPVPEGGQLVLVCKVQGGKKLIYYIIYEYNILYVELLKTQIHSNHYVFFFLIYIIRSNKELF